MTQLKRRVAALESVGARETKCPLTADQIDRKITLLLKKRDKGLSETEQAELDALPKIQPDPHAKPMTEAEGNARIEELLAKRH